MLRPALAALAVAAVGVLPACVAAGEQAAEGKLRVVTTVAPLTSIVAAVGGDRVHVTGLVPEGTDSHTFEPPPSAARALSRADVVFVNGLSLDDSIADLAHKNARRHDGGVVALGDEVLQPRDYIYDFSFPKAAGKPNPHLWTDPTYAIRYAAVVRRTLGQLTSEVDRAYLDQRFSAFERQATALSEALRSAQATVPSGQRRLLTYHDAYAYFARTYGWQVIGAIQPKSFADPTPKEVAAIITEIRRLKVPTIFGSEVFPSRVLERIGRETGARYEDTLRDDDLLGKPGDPEHSWAGLMRYNYVTMIEGLGGDAAALRALDLAPVGPQSADYPQ